MRSFEGLVFVTAPASEGGHYKCQRGLIVAGAVEDLDGVGEELGEGVERFNCAFGAAGKIEDEGKVADDGDAARQHSHGSLRGALAAHLFGKAGDHFFGDVESGFGCVVAGT